ncbi:hypothetical protein EST38_g13446 [Candolleomyces aberdarensis]|uniref:Nephrocystin 3-like N-terminal domain-containing protein n=1 Tax=Candolleomyces aberdarensis TaxID=2316362 RepID=A0A4Q2CZY0_9AGAR|nr:hypothetical protein EST38_g13446 [Candolleomyces aberdarensis]
MNRFAATLASQLVAAIPATTSLIQDAVSAEPGLVTGEAVIESGVLGETLSKGPFLIVVDGLDECEDKRGAEALIDHILAFFEGHPSIPLRIFIASRVEQHIRMRLKTNRVRLGNLDTQSPLKDIEKFLHASFQAVAKRDRLIQAYVETHGEWPAKSDTNKLIEHVGGSFALASTIFKFIIQPATKEDPLTPLERLPLVVNMNGLDDLYAQTLSRSQHFPHFRNIISTIALLHQPLPIVGIADLLGIQAFEVAGALLGLQAIIHVPGTDKVGKVTPYHSSLCDFLKTESRSGSFFVPPSFHLRLSYYSFASVFERSNGQPNQHGVPSVTGHLVSMAFSGACNFIDEIKRFEARRSLNMSRGRLPSHAFLCSTFFHSIVWDVLPIWDYYPYILTHCTEQLALAVECPDSRILLWLEKELFYGFGFNPMRTLQFTEEICETVQQHLQRVSTALQAKFPELLMHHYRPTGTNQKHRIRMIRFSGIDIFKALQWMVARSHFKWEEAKITTHHPLELSIFRDWTRHEIIFSFDGALDRDDSDSAPTSSDSD